MRSLASRWPALADAPAVRVWRVPAYRRFMSGLTPYYISTWIQRVGVGWLAWEMSHSHAWVGAIAAADLVPLVLLGPFAGAMADRVDPVKLMRWSQLAMVAQAVLLTAMALSGLLNVWLLLGLSLMTGLIQPNHQAARQTVVPLTVGRENYASAVTLDSSLYHGSRFIGPMLAALVITRWGVISTFAIHIAGCLIFYIQLTRMGRLESAPRAARHTGMLEAIVAGGVYVRRHTGIWPLFLMLAVTSLVARPMQELLPGFAGGVFRAGPTGLAWLTSTMGLGALAAALFLAMRGHARGLATGSIASTLAVAIATFGFVATDRLALALPFAVVWGFSLTLMGVGIQAQTQIAVADEMRGRVMMIYAILYRGLPAVGALVIGWIAGFIGIRSTFAFAALLTALAWLALAPRHREIDRSMQRRTD